MNDLFLPEIFARSLIGSDRFARLDEKIRNFQNNSFPPYNILKKDENHYELTLALAGYSSDDIVITKHNDVLTIEYKKIEDDSDGKYLCKGISAYLYKGISARAFKRQFILDQYVEVDEAKMVNGLLVIELERRVPDHAQAKTIPINGSKKSLDFKNKDVE